jgi:hypothetical protein
VQETGRECSNSLVVASISVHALTEDSDTESPTRDLSGLLVSVVCLGPLDCQLIITVSIFEYSEKDC